MRKRIRDFIRNNLNIFDGNVEFDDSDNIFAAGFVDSLFAIELVTFLEEEFSIEIQNEDLEIDTFQSVDNMVAFVEEKTQARTGVD